MTEDTHKIIVQAVKDAVETTVNGKIKGIQSVLDSYIASDMEWKKNNEEALENMKNLTVGWKVFLSFVTSVGAIGGALFVILKLLKVVK